MAPNPNKIRILPTSATSAHSAGGAPVSCYTYGDKIYGRDLVLPLHYLPFSSLFGLLIVHLAGSMAPHLTLQDIVVYSALVGVASHLGYFIRGEHHLEGLTLLLLALISPAAVFVAAQNFLEIGSGEAAKVTIAALLSYYGALFTDIVIYRLLFHRLRRFPGPPLLKITKLYHMALIAKRKNNWVVRDAWHRKYGDVVRVGKKKVPKVPRSSLMTSDARPCGALDHYTRGGPHYLGSGFKVYEIRLV